MCAGNTTTEIGAMEKIKEESVAEELPIEFAIKYKTGSGAVDFIEEVFNKKINVKTRNSKIKCVMLDEKYSITIN